MTLALALTLLSLQATPPAAPATTPVAPPPAAAAPTIPTTVSPLVVEAPATAPDPETIAADLALVYDQSCGGRIYGMYADACNTLSSQLAKAQAEARKSAAKKAKAAKSSASGASAR